MRRRVSGRGCSSTAMRAALVLVWCLVQVVMVATATTHVAAAAANVNVVLVDWISTLGVPSEQIDPSYLRVSVNFFRAVRDFNARDVGALPALDAVRTCQKNLSVIAFCDESGSSRRAAALVTEFAAQAHAFVGFASLPGPLEATVAADTLASIPLVSHWSTATALNDVAAYPRFARVVVADDMFVVRLAAFCESLGLSALGVLYMNSDSGPLVQQALQDELRSRGISAQAFAFTYQDQDSITAALTRFAATSHAALVVFAYLTDFQLIANAAAAIGFNSPQRIVILTNFDILPTVDAIAASPELTAFMEGAFAVRDGITDDALFRTYLSPRVAAPRDDLVAGINARLPPQGNASGLAPQSSCRNDPANFSIPNDFFSSGAGLEEAQDVWARAYDAVMTVGFAACGVDMGPTPPPTAALSDAIVQVDFQGLSGRVKFDPKTRSRAADTQGFVLLNWRPSPAEHREANETELTVSTVAVYNATSGVWVASDAFYFRGNATSPPPTFVHPPLDMLYLPVGLRVLGYVEFALVQTAVLVALSWLWYRRQHRLVLAGQRLSLVAVACGTSLAAFALLALTVDDAPDQPFPADAACRFGPHVFFLGSFLAMSALGVKLWRATSMFNPHALLHTGTYPPKLLAACVAANAINLAVVASWAAADDVRLAWDRFIVLTDQLGSPLVSMGQCYSFSMSNPTGPAALLAFVSVAHVAAIYVAWRGASAARKVQAPDELHDARWMTLLCTVQAQLFVLAAAAAVAVYDTPIARFIVLSSFVFVWCLATVFFVFAPRAGRVRADRLAYICLLYTSDAADD